MRNWLAFNLAVVVLTVWQSIAYAHGVPSKTQHARISVTRINGSAHIKPTRAPKIISPKVHLSHTKVHTPPPPPPFPYVNVKTYGALGNGSTDDTPAINKAMIAALQAGWGVYFPPGNYVYLVSLTVPVPLLGAGASTVLTANAAYGIANGLILSGNGVGVSNMKLSGAGITVVGGNNFSINQLTIAGANNGLVVQNSNSGTISNILIPDAANIGVTIQDSNNIQLLNSSISSKGQYALQTVSQLLNGSLSHLTYAYNQISGNVSITSAHTCVFDYNTVAGGVIFGSLYYQSNFPCSGLEIIGNVIDGGSHGMSGNVGGLVLANYTSGAPPLSIDSVRIANNTVSNFPNCMQLFSVSNCTATSNTLTNAKESLLASSSYYNLNVSENTLSNSGDSGIALASYGGSLQLSNNQLTNCCTRVRGAIIDVENYAGVRAPITISSNLYKGPINLAKYYIRCMVPGSASNPNITGNTETVLLPNYLAP